MPIYKYTALEKNGKEKKASMEAASEEAVAAAIKAEGGIPLSIKKPNFLTQDINFHIGKKVKTRELGIFCRQFESIMAAGVTVISALDMLSEQTENKEFAKAIRSVKVAVERGDSLADAMRVEEDVFPGILISMVEAGEASGSLEVAFARMGSHFEKDSHLRGIVAKAMIYPAILMMVIIGVVIMMMVVIIPQFTETFKSLGATLPTITRVVMGISDALVNRWYIFLGILFALVVGLKSVKQSTKGALALGRMALKAPIFGNLNVKSACARLTRTLSTLLVAGISLVDAVEIASNVMTNKVVEAALKEAKGEVVRGVPLSKTLEASGVFPPLVYHMTGIGEETGNMETMLDKIADYYDEEVELATEAMTAALEPLIIIVMAAIVVPLILAIMLPMLTAYNSVGI